MNHNQARYNGPVRNLCGDDLSAHNTAGLKMAHLWWANWLKLIMFSLTGTFIYIVTYSFMHLVFNLFPLHLAVKML